MASYRHNHRDQYARYEEALLDFLLLPLGNDKLNAETYHIGYDDFGKHGQETVTEHLPKTAGRARGMEVLVSHIVHTEQQGRYQSNDHHRHDALAIDGVMNVRPRFRRGVGHKEECLEALEHRAKCVVFAALFKVRLYLVEIIS